MCVCVCLSVCLRSVGAGPADLTFSTHMKDYHIVACQVHHALVKLGLVLAVFLILIVY